jgi:hypothetical protein
MPQVLQPDRRKLLRSENRKIWSEHPPRSEHRKPGLNAASCIDLNFGSFFDLKIGNWPECHKFFDLIVGNFFDLKIRNWPECHKFFNLNVGNFFDLKIGTWSEYHLGLITGNSPCLSASAERNSDT